MLAQRRPPQDLTVEPTGQGWRITHVSTQARKAGLETGDLIVRINRVPVQSVLAPLLWASLLAGACSLPLHVRDCRTGRLLLVRLRN